MIRPEEKTELRRYLLGELSEADEGRVEQRLLSDDLYFTEHEMTVDDLISEYIRGTLSSDQRLLLERHFLVAPERQKKLAFAIALNEAALAHAAQKRKSSPIKPSPLFTRFLSATPFYLRVAAALRALVVEVATGRFGEVMAVELVNDGPFTIWLDTAER